MDPGLIIVEPRRARRRIERDLPGGSDAQERILDRRAGSPGERAAARLPAAFPQDRTRRMSRSWLVLLLLASPLAAQQDSALRDAVRLVNEGRGDSARALVRRRLASPSPADSTY